ncbi:MAG: hypothetical protein JRN68_05030 [Nitrososphaerota archaeon]|nr:hypothetical protein [Nitrososphaerota archaeon]
MGYSRMRCYAVVSGPDVRLSIDEVSAVLESCDFDQKLQVEGKIVLFDAYASYDEVISRLAFISEAGRVLDIVTGFTELDQEKIAAEFSGRRFKVDSEGFRPDDKRKIDAEMGRNILKMAKGSSVSLHDPEKVFRIIRYGEAFLCGILERRFRGRWKERRPRARPFFHPVAIFPKFSRLMVNLSRVRKGGLFLDPCAGTGSLLLEAADMGIETIGMDVSKKMVFGFTRNLKAYAAENHHEILGDARYMPLREVSGMATDIPYGRASALVGGRSPYLARAVLEQALSLLKKGGCIVIMTSGKDRPGEVGGLEQISVYDLYVHRSLTRRLSVYRRR